MLVMKQYMHTVIHTYTHTYIHTYIHTKTYMHPLTTCDVVVSATVECYQLVVC